MQQEEFETLVKDLCQKETLPEVLEALKVSEEQEVVDAAVSLTGQFQLAEIDNEKRIYHVFTQENDDGEEEEYVEWVMNDGDEMLKFVAWFFYIMFEIKHKDTYQVVGRTYLQQKRG
jgi:hypothetical protein